MADSLCGSSARSSRAEEPTQKLCWSVPLRLVPIPNILLRPASWEAYLSPSPERSQRPLVCLVAAATSMTQDVATCSPDKRLSCNNSEVTMESLSRVTPEIIHVGYKCQSCGTRMSVLTSAAPPPRQWQGTVSTCTCGRLYNIRLEKLHTLEVWREKAQSANQ
jgi:hypothetical protein